MEPRQRQNLFKLLAEGVSVAAAARQVGVHNTVGYWEGAVRRVHSLGPAKTGKATRAPLQDGEREAALQ